MAAQPRQNSTLDQSLRKRRRSNLEKPLLAWKRERRNEGGQHTDILWSEDGLKGDGCQSELLPKQCLRNTLKQESILRFVTQQSDCKVNKDANVDNCMKGNNFWHGAEEKKLSPHENWDLLKEGTSEEYLFDDASISSLLSSPFEEFHEEEDIDEDEPLCPVAPAKRISFGSSADVLLQQVYDFYGR